MKSKKKQPIKLQLAYVEFLQLKDGRVKATLYKSMFDKDGDKWELWFPEAAKGRNGMIAPEILLSRLKHDHAVEVGHYSTMMTWEK